MDNIQGSGPIRPNIPPSETGSTSKSSDAAHTQALLKKAPGTLRTFTKQLSNALLPLQDKRQGLASTIKGGRALDAALEKLNSGDPSGSLASIKEAKSLPCLPQELQTLLSQAEGVLAQKGTQEDQLSELSKLNESYVHSASMQAMDFSHKIIKSGESLGRMSMDLKEFVEKTRLSS